MAEAFDETCTAGTRLVFAVDGDDPERDAYVEAVAAIGLRINTQPSGSMVSALNHAATEITNAYPNLAAIAFMGDDHRPRTRGWDAAYLAALELHPGLVYGNDLLQGPNLPTQVAMSACVVRALGHMAPPPLTHLYVDNYWRDLGHAAGCITYLPDVVVEHMHPFAGKGSMDAGYERVNDATMYDRDRDAYAQYWAEHGARDVAAVREAVAVAARG
jgi:hypothetical protein